MVLHFPVPPMKATMGSISSIPDDGWAFEIKWDGYRTIVHVADGRARLQSTAGHDVTERWPEFDGISSAVNASSVILDGELVAFGDDGKPSFEMVQRSGVGSTRQAVLQFFDVLQIDGIDTIDLPYVARRRLLEQLVEPGANWTVPASRIGGGADLVEATAAQGLEGVIAKRLDSPYRPGARSKDWHKIKNRTRVEVTIGGFTTGTGNRASTFGALLVGRPNADSLTFAGGVGTGFDHRTLETLTERLHGLVVADCPFVPAPPAAVRRSARWVQPVLRAEIEIAEFTNDGLARHASFLTLISSP